MANFVLDMSAMEKDFFSESALVGISTALPGYHLCWQIDRRFDTRFYRADDQLITQKKVVNKEKKELVFPVYSYEFPDSSFKYLLYTLKFGRETLLPELRNLDFLWMLFTADPESDAEEIASTLRGAEGIQLATVIDRSQVKNLKNLLT